MALRCSLLRHLQEFEEYEDQVQRENGHGLHYLRDAEEPYPDVDEAEEVALGVIVDFDREERPVGIEIYDGARAKLAGTALWKLEDERAL